MLDVLIVGGGASGLALGAMLKEKDSSLSVTVAEQLDRVGKKLAITGNGRCNITNKLLHKDNFHSHFNDKAIQTVSDFDFTKTSKFFSGLGIEFSFENNKAYPLSFQASSVVDVFRFILEKQNVKVETNCKITEIKKEGNVFKAYTESRKVLKAKCVVIATGGLAGGNKLGSTGDGYRLLKSFGHKIYEQKPVIVQVKTDNTFTRQLKGIKVTAEASVIVNSKTIKKDCGEVLFCDYGLSGPPILQLSRYLTKGAEISLDLLKDLDTQDIIKLLNKRADIFKDVPLTDFFAGFIHKKLGQIILKKCGLSLSMSGADLTPKDINNIAKVLKAFKFKYEGNTGFANAQSTSGGADLSDFSENFMSKKQKGLFAMGEVLDVDGDCGGYNLQWAWSSANAVSNGILSYLRIKGIKND